MEIKLDNKTIESLVFMKIEASVASALADHSGVFIEKIVHAAMNEKVNSYDRETKFGKAISEAIRAEATKALTVWLDEQKPAIHAVVTKRLNAEKKGLVTKFADSLVEGLRGDLRVTAYIKGSGND